MLYHIEGEDRVTKAARTMEVNADSAAEASTQATAAAGIVVARISKASAYAGNADSHRDSSTRRAPRYELLRQCASTIATLGCVVTLVGIGIGLLGAMANSLATACWLRTRS